MTDQKLPGVQGTIGLLNDPLRGFLITVDGEAAPRAKGETLLPGTDGQPVRARVHGRFVSEHPRITVGDQSFSTGPDTPPLLLLLVFVPLLLALGSTPLPIVLAIVSVLINLYLLRSEKTEAKKTIEMLGVFVVAVGVNSLWLLLPGLVSSGR